MSVSLSLLLFLTLPLSLTLCLCLCLCLSLSLSLCLTLYVPLSLSASVAVSHSLSLSLSLSLTLCRSVSLLTQVIDLLDVLVLADLEAVRERQQEILAVHLFSIYVYEAQRFSIYVYEVTYGNKCILSTYMRTSGTYMRNNLEAVRERQQEVLAVYLSAQLCVYEVM